MKKIGLILAGCLAFIGLCGAHAEDIGGVARAAVRRATTISSRQNSTNSGINSRTNNTTTSVRGRTGTTTRNTPTVSERNASVSARTTTNVVPRATSGAMTSRNTAISARTGSGTVRTATRTPLNSTNRKSQTLSRAATNNSVRDDVLTRNYSKCKTVFFECMDEFCANKDAQLKRCACSSRIHEFDSVKKQLANVEDKMLDFNQRLLTVSMDKEDAAALSIATDGELAYNKTTDNTQTKKTLDEIASKFNTSFNSSNFNSDLAPISWSLNEDTAFDSVDSLLGASTVTKSGTELYSAALPVCRQMAAEVCSESDLSLAESGYMAVIEQDCNTVSKTYKTQTEQARAKVLESSALLDMSRLDVYQKRNSDNFLTCKKKMLDTLTDSTVCGSELGKCLDVTGQYIDPSTGEAFLTPNLVNLDTLLTRPSGNNTWTTVPNNAAFVTFLNSKKKFLAPATEQCQEIADSVWDEFLEDALAQIKLAQDKKLETVRQSCTTLTAQCLSDATKSITNFDARALSTFGISADITANVMCANVLDTCTVLLQSVGGGEDWASGIYDITTSTTYETMMRTCRQVGQACIIQVCTSTSGNFGLCESVSSSTNRKTIINQTACWDEVKDCIRNVGADAIDSIITQYGMRTDNNLNFYDNMYNQDYRIIVEDAKDSRSISTCIDGDKNCIYDICTNECADESSLFECRVCRLAENIWGNCELPPITPLDVAGAHNKIKESNGDQTLLWWFANNTGTANLADSCRDTTCGIGYIASVSTDGMITCIDANNACWAGYDNNYFGPAIDTKIQPGESTRCQNCAQPLHNGAICCESKEYVTGDNSQQYCASTGSQIIAHTGDYKQVLICDGGTMTIQNDSPHCNGTLVLVNLDSGDKIHYSSPTDASYVTETFMSGKTQNDAKQCIYDDGNWKTQDDGACPVPNPNAWSVVFDTSGE